eukprot:bmy_21610T0
MTLASWLSKSISSPVATNQPNAAIDGNTKDRSHTIWSLEEQECTQLIHDILKRDNTTYLLYADLGEHTSALLRENIDLSVSDKNSVSSAFVKGLIQGIVYGSIASALFSFFLVLLA